MKLKDGKFVITGGASLIGSHIADHLLLAGAGEVVLLDNYSLGSPDAIAELLKDDRVKLVRGDILRINELFDAFEGADGVFAVAGFLTLPLSLNPSLGLAVNIDGMMNTYEACRYRGVKKVVFSSSVAVYGETEEDITAEPAPWEWYKQQPGAALYGATKIIGENIGRLYHDRHGVQSVSLRYSSVYGERQHFRAVNSVYIIDTYDRVRRGERPIIPDDGSEVHDYIHVADIARANLIAMESDVSRESFNVATGISTSLNDLVRIIQAKAGTNLEPEYKTPAGKIRATVSSTLKFSNKKSQEQLGWRPEVSLDDGIERLIRWRDGEGKLAA